VKTALTPTSLQQSGEIDTGPFTGAASYNVILLSVGIRYSIAISWMHAHTEYYVHDETMRVSVD
jgi:hypothetical protein